MIRNADLIAELRKPGKVEVPFNSQHDMFHVLAEKADLLRILKKLDPAAAAPWYVDLVHDDGTRSLAVQDDFMLVDEENSQ